MSLVVAAVILWGMWGLLRDSVNMAMDAVPANVDLEEVSKSIGQQSGVTNIHDSISGQSARLKSR